MPHRILLIILLLLLSACAAPPPPPDAALSPSPAPLLEETPTSLPTPQPTLVVPTPTPLPTPPPPLPSPTPGGPLSRVAAWGAGVPLAATYLPDGQSMVVLRPLALELRAATRLADLRWRVPLATPPSALAVTPDGSTLAVSVAAVVDLYATEDGRFLGRIPGLGSPIAAIAISPDGRLLAAAQADQIVSLWDVAERSNLTTLRLPLDEAGMIVPGSFTSVAFSPDNQFLAAGDDGGNVGVWAMSDLVALQVLSVGVRVVSDVAFAPNSQQIAAASEGWRSEPGAIWIWDVATGEEKHWLGIADATRFLAPAQRLAFRPDGAEVLMGLADGSLLRWRLADTSTLAQELVGHTAAITALAMAQDGRILTAARDGSLRTWNPDGSPADTLSDAGAIVALALSSDGSLIVSGDEGGQISIRQPDATLITQIQSPGGSLRTLALSPDASLLASGSADGTLRLWALPSGELQSELPGHEGSIFSLAFSPDGQRVATVGDDGTLRLWRISGAAERVTPVLQSDGISATALYHVAFAPDGQQIAVASSAGEISLWRSADLTQIERRSIEPDRALQLSFTPQNNLLARTASGKILAWAAGSPVALLDTHVGSYALLGDAGLVTLGGGTFQVWRGPLSALARYAEVPVPGFNRLTANATTIVVGSSMGMIEVWAVR
ncbi:G-protein beta WD-40 repeats containing protein, putative [Oscillochloris trichoides DG-6]|uniref:G-protein beta WD-40 repeats containing protein, putative n=1 Tax=Oscillochloris trichoides DG-6 TaxID=765420 RepID=E1IDV5_9CHLR|nr:WD40 repeat domain-containing protein [Oscillochloris trichoides]EFO80624.1 G-protein beta WD-40 repeats containing protein, putative [Oscillochloris trichoides DG-6]